MEKALLLMVNPQLLFSSEVLTSPEKTGEGCLGQSRTAHLSSTKKMRSLFSAVSPKPGRVKDMRIQRSEPASVFRDTFCGSNKKTWKKSSF